MSNALAIAAVTAVLKSLLEEHVANLGGSVQVTVSAPDLILPNNTGADSEDHKLNLFLYQVTPNSGWRNVGLPSRDSGGKRVSNPPLGLDLHYLLTAYSKESFWAEMLLGYGVQLLHEISVLTRSAIRKALKEFENGASPISLLVETGLAEQVEQIKICPQSLSSEEISKLWSAFQTHYRPTAAYQVSVVLIESQHSTKSALPVRQPRLPEGHEMSFRQPLLTAVLPQIVNQGSQLTLKGQNLKADLVSVDFGTVTASPDRLTDRQILVTLPTSLLAGINTVQVIHSLDFGTPSEPHQGFESNVMPFVLRPQIVPPVRAGSGTSPGTVEVTVPVEPVIGKSQRVVMRLNELTSNAPAAYSAISERRDQDTSAIAITFSSVKAGIYLVRIQVDGAESLLDVDSNNQYTGTPNVTITCPSNCLRSSSISLSSTLAGEILTVTGEVTVENESGTALGDVEVTITWTLPDGSTQTETQTIPTDSEEESTQGIATFNIAGSRGTYILTVTNLSKKDHCFDPLNSTLSDSITG